MASTHCGSNGDCGSNEEENGENIDPVNNFDPEDSEDDLGETDSTARDKKLNAITASDKLGMACFRCVTKNSCSIPNCEYSHDRDIVAAARDKQMADLTEAKRQMQAGHQATLKIFDEQGVKAVKSNPPQMRLTQTDTIPKLSLLSPSWGDIIDKHTGCEDPGCSPNKYMRAEYFEQHEAYLSQYIIKESPERVDLATSYSAQYITRHVQLSLRHVDSRGRMRLMTLKFGILKGLRFDMVIGLWAISFHFK